MTVEEKRQLLVKYCQERGNCEINGCVLWTKDWEHVTRMGCLIFKEANEAELDRALELIRQDGYGYVLPVREAEGIKSAATVIQLEVTDSSPMQIAYAICNFFEESWDTEENALIQLDELTEHIDAYVRAERKALEYKKMAEEG